MKQPPVSLWWESFSSYYERELKFFQVRNDRNIGIFRITNFNRACLTRIRFPEIRNTAFSNKVLNYSHLIRNYINSILCSKAMIEFSTIWIEYSYSTCTVYQFLVNRLEMGVLYQLETPISKRFTCNVCVVCVKLLN